MALVRNGLFSLSVLLQCHNCICVFTTDNLDLLIKACSNRKTNLYIPVNNCNNSGLLTNCSLWDVIMLKVIHVCAAKALQNEGFVSNVVFK